MTTLVSSSTCPACSQRLGQEVVSLWDGRSYCRDCVRRVSPHLLDLAVAGGPLRDAVERKQVKAWHFIRWIGPWYVIGVLVTFGIPFGLLVAFGNAPIEALLLVLGFFGGFGLLFLGLQGLLGAAAHRWRIPREITVDNGTVTITTPQKVESVPLDQCRWSVGHTAADQLCMFTGLRRGIILRTPQDQLAIGHQPGSVENWKCFLELCRLPQASPVGCLATLGMCVVGLVGGAALGWGLGQVAAPLVNNPLLEITVPILGGIDGLFGGLLLAACTSEGAIAARKRLHPAVIGLTFMLLGLKVGLGGNWHTALIGSAFNGVLGFVIGWICQLRIRAAEMEQELQQFNDYRP